MGTRSAAALTYLRGASPVKPMVASRLHRPGSRRAPPTASYCGSSTWAGRGGRAVPPGSVYVWRRGGSDQLGSRDQAWQGPWRRQAPRVGWDLRRGVPSAGAQTYLGARSRSSGHMMLDRVYPDVEPQVVSVGAAAQSETGCPEGTRVRRRSRPQNHHSGACPRPSVSPPPHAAAGQASEPSSRRVW